MENENLNTNELEMEIPEMGIKIGKDYIEMDDYLFFLGSEIVDELMQWLMNANKSKEDKKQALKYYCRAFALLRPDSKAKVRRMMTELEQYKFILEEYINTIFKNIYD